MYIGSCIWSINRREMLLKSINELIILNLPYLQMEYKLRTEKSNITIFGFSDIPNFQWILLGIFLVLYLTILMCNSVIVLITRIDPTPQTPMYFFLNHFSILEICYVTVTIPRMLTDLLSQKGHISFIACAIQMCLVLLFGGLECLLLAWWPMTTTWPFVTLFTMDWLWAPRSVSSWSLPPGPVEFLL